MKLYTIPEALTFLAEEYGANRMPTSQETLRRAIRTGDLLVQEEGDPGRKGYTISEADLRTYARNRLSRMDRRSTAPVKVSVILKKHCPKPPLIKKLNSSMNCMLSS